MEQEKRYIEEDEITLKELILKVQEYFWEVVRNWKWVVLITIPFVVYFLYKAISTPVIYTAELTFMVNEDDGGGLGGMSAILGQFGLGGGGKGKNNLDKILELARSRNIIQQVLFDTVSISGKKDIIGNHIIKLYDYHEKWEKDTTGLKEFLFKGSDQFSKTRINNKVLKALYRKIIGTPKVPGLFSKGYGEETGIMEFTVNSLNEDLSIHLCKGVYEKLSTFYVTKTIEKQRETFDLMLQKVDSLKEEMQTAEYGLANFRDSHTGLFTTRARLKEMQLQRDVQLLNEMYAVSLKNFEIADFSLKNKTPFIQLIDEPLAPLSAVEESKTKNILLGVFFGVSLAFIFIIGRKVLRETME